MAPSYTDWDLTRERVAEAFRPLPRRLVARLAEGALRGRRHDLAAVPASRRREKLDRRMSTEGLLDLLRAWADSWLVPLLASTEYNRRCRLGDQSCRRAVRSRPGDAVRTQIQLLQLGVGQYDVECCGCMRFGGAEDRRGDARPVSYLGERDLGPGTCRSVAIRATCSTINRSPGRSRLLPNSSA
jgi:hypothetical protein